MSSTSSGLFDGQMPRESPGSYTRPEAPSESTTARVSLSLWPVLSGVADSSLSFTGRSREGPAGSAWGAADDAPGGAAATGVSSSSFFNARVVAFPPGTHLAVSRSVPPAMAAA
jgi:hypothetical protein